MTRVLKVSVQRDTLGTDATEAQVEQYAAALKTALAVELPGHNYEVRIDLHRLGYPVDPTVDGEDLSPSEWFAVEMASNRAMESFNEK